MRLYNFMEYEEKLDKLNYLIQTNKVDKNNKGYKVGVDLGTANIVLVVVDENKEPVAGKTYPSTVVKDGVVIDYIGAINILKKLKLSLEESLDTKLSLSNAALPPNVDKSNYNAIKNIVESCDFDIEKIVLEPDAAAKVLNIENGAVVDLGGGTTGISIIKDGKSIYSYDEATGGIHMDLVVSGYYGVSLREAEILKKSATKEITNLVRPTLEKMATITSGIVSSFNIDEIYLVGGSSCFEGIEKIFEDITNIKTRKIDNALLVTPYGIAIS